MASDIENGTEHPTLHFGSADGQLETEVVQQKEKSADKDVDESEALEALGKLKSTSTKKRIRIIEAEKHARRVDTERTLASVLLGKGSQAEHLLFALFVKQRWPSRILWSLWWLGAICGLLNLVRLVPQGVGYVALLMLPLPFIGLSVLSLDLVWEVLHCFECYLVTGMQILLLINTCMLLQDRRIIFWVCYLPTMLCASFVDAYPAKFRSVFARLYFTSMGCVYLLWIFFLVFGVLEPIYDRSWKAGELSGKAVSSLAQNTATLLAFCARQLCSALWKPNTFVIIVSPMRTSRIYVEAELELIDGEWKATGRYVRDEKQRTTRLQMDDDELHRINRLQLNEPRVNSKISTLSKVKSNLEVQETIWKTISNLGLIEKLTPSARKSVRGSLFGGEQMSATFSEETKSCSEEATAPMCSILSSVLEGSREISSRIIAASGMQDMAVQTDFELPSDQLPSSAVNKQASRQRRSLPEVEQIKVLILPSSVQVQKPLEDQPLLFPDLESGTSVCTGTNDVRPCFLEDRYWAPQHNGASARSVADDIGHSKFRPDRPERLLRIDPHGQHNRHHHDNHHNNGHENHQIGCEQLGSTVKLNVVEVSRIKRVSPRDRL